MNIIKMRYSIEPRERRYVKGYGFLSFAKNIGKHLSHKYGQKLADTAKKICNRCIKNCYQKSNSKTADKITSISKKPASEPHSNAASKEIPKERYISLQERQKIIDE